MRFAADLIKLDTTNHGGGDGQEREAAEYVADRLAEAGLEPVLLEAALGRTNVVARVLLRAAAPRTSSVSETLLYRAAKGQLQDRNWPLT